MIGEAERGLRVEVRGYELFLFLLLVCCVGISSVALPTLTGKLLDFYVFITVIIFSKSMLPELTWVMRYCFIIYCIVLLRSIHKLLLKFVIAVQV